MVGKEIAAYALEGVEVHLEELNVSWFKDIFESSFSFLCIADAKVELRTSSGESSSCFDPNARRASCDKDNLVF